MTPTPLHSPEMQHVAAARTSGDLSAKGSKNEPSDFAPAAQPPKTLGKAAQFKMSIKSLLQNFSIGKFFKSSFSESNFGSRIANYFKGLISKDSGKQSPASVKPDLKDDVKSKEGNWNLDEIPAEGLPPAPEPSKEEVQKVKDREIKKFSGIIEVPQKEFNAMVQNRIKAREQAKTSMQPLSETDKAKAIMESQKKFTLPGTPENGRKA